MRDAAADRSAAATRQAAEIAAKDADARTQDRVVANMSDALGQLDSGDLSARIASPAHDPFPAEYEALRLSFNTVAARLAETMTSIVGVAEEGRGREFAAMASEVRGLAQRALDSAREIKDLIHESSQHVQSGATLVARTGDSLSDILNRARGVSDQVAAILVAANDQSAARGEVNTGVNQLDQVTQQNAAVTE